MKTSINHALISLLCLFSAPILIGCAAQNTKDANSTAVPSLSFPTITQTISPLQTTSPIPSTPETTLPDGSIVFTIGTTRNESDSCISDFRDQMWIAHYPYQSASLLLSDPEADFRFPTFSPDGEWIAYVVSKPIEVLEPSAFPEKTGTDSVWIMRPDGSGRRKMSNDAPSLFIRTYQGECSLAARIENLSWSPDGKFLLHKQSKSDENSNYYLIDIQQQSSRLLLSLPYASFPFWIRTGKADLVLSMAGEIKVVSRLGETDIVIDSFPLPTEVSSEIGNFFSQEDDSLIGIFSLDGPNLQPEKLSLWRLNLLSGSWKKIKDIDASTFNFPKAGNRWASICSAEKFTIVDLQTWEIVGESRIPSKIENMDCNYQISSPGHDTDIVVYYGYTGNIFRFWALRLMPGSPGSIPVFDSTIIPSWDALPVDVGVMDFSIRIY